MLRAPLTLTILAGTFAAGTVAHADCGDVTITEMDWASGAVITNVATFLMEQGYGCDVTKVPSSTVPSLISVAETGEPDIVTELWINGAPAYNDLQAEGKIVTLTDVLSDGGREGWWIPKYLVDAHPELATVEGVLANAELLGGRFHTCPEGWACKNTNADLLKNFGVLDAGFEVFEHGSGETLASSIAAAYTDGEPWFGYYWAPTALLGKYEMVDVDLGPYVEDIFLCAADADCEAEGVSGWPVGSVKTVVTTSFQAEEPEVSAMLESLAFTNDQMGEVLAWAEDNNASYEEAAVYFLRSYTEVWPDWLSEEARANLAALVQ